MNGFKKFLAVYGMIVSIWVISSFAGISTVPNTQIVTVTDTVEIPVPYDTCASYCDYYIAEVIGTPYQPTVAQCDSTPYNTGDGSFIDTNLLKTNSIRWVALSQDQLWFNGGAFHYGDTVWVYSEQEAIRGAWVVHDAMNKKHKKRIDFLQWFDSPIHRTRGLIISNKPLENSPSI